MLRWIDTHCHLDAAEFQADRQAVRARATQAGVVHCVIPAVSAADFEAVRALAHDGGDSYALGIHPLYVAQATQDDLLQLEEALRRHRDDPRLVAVGEIGLDYLVPALCQSPLRERQEDFYTAQLRLARRYGLPVILHVRRSADRLLKGLRQEGRGQPWLGIAHAFNGSAQQAQAFIDQGLRLGFGGALSYARAQQLRRLAAQLPLSALVLETDAPDMPPQWLYTTAAQRAQGVAQGRNEPAELPRIAQVMAELRGLDLPALSAATQANALAALPRLQGLLATAVLG